MRDVRYGRREFIRASLAVITASAVTMSAGCKKEADAGGEALITVGSTVMKLKHPGAKIVGLAIVTAGSSLKFYAKLEGGREVEILESQEKLKAVVAAKEKGVKAQVNQSESKETVTITTKD